MNLQLHPAEPLPSGIGLLTLFAVTAADRPDAFPGAVPRLLHEDASVLRATSAVLASGEFTGAVGETLLLHAPAGVPWARLLLVGVGVAGKLNLSALRQGAGTAIRFAKDKRIRAMAIAVPGPGLSAGEGFVSTALTAADAVQAIAEGVLLADMDTDRYKTDRKDRSLGDVGLLLPDGVPLEPCKAALERGVVLAESQNFARSLVLEPGNVLTPTEMGRRAAAMAAETGISCEVHSTEFLLEQGMHAFLAVARGSAEPPALIVLRYEPAAALPENAPTVAIVGKGITFDTGGISIKSADGMDKMKYDMAGAAAMLGAMRAVAHLRPAVRVLCVVCSAENMPSGTAYRPGDVITAMSGKTIEVMNTDAEGRMVLADGLHYARTLGATHLADAATLTGACVVALGKLNAGLFSNDDDTCARFAAAAVHAGESFWRLPCTDAYADLIKSQIADIQNTGVDKWGGAITAAMFLKEFVADTPWVHLDIAGQAWIDDARSYIAKGPSGFAVRTLMEWIRSYEVQ